MALRPVTPHSVPTHLNGGGWVSTEPSATRRAAGPDTPSLPLPTRGGRRPPGGGSRRALCLWLPTFELRLELVRYPELDATSAALLSGDERVRRTIWQVSERAHDAGVRPGQLVSQAVSLCPSLTLLEPDPAHYDAANEAMLETLSTLTPVLEPSGRGRVFLGMDGMERLLGPPARQAARALHALFSILPPPLVAATRAGMAPGTFGAWVAATAAKPGRPVLVDDADLPRFLARCPVGVLPVDPRTIQRMERLGVRTLGELRRFPEPALVTQFGEEGRSALGWATGRRIDPVRPWRRPRPIRVSLDFPAPAGTSGILHGAVDRLVARALSRPARRGRSITGLRIGAHLEGGGSWFADVVLRTPSAERERITFVLRSRMERTPPPRAVETLILEFTDFGPPAAQTSLFDRRAAGSRSGETRSVEHGEVSTALRDAVRELKLRLGYSPLYRVVEMDPWSRIPERRHALLNFDP